MSRAIAARAGISIMWWPAMVRLAIAQACGSVGFLLALSFNKALSVLDKGSQLLIAESSPSGIVVIPHLRTVGRLTTSHAFELGAFDNRAHSSLGCSLLWIRRL